MRMNSRWLTVPALAAAWPSSAQMAVPATVLDPVVVTAERAGRPSFDVPAAIASVGREVIDSGGPQVNLSEALSRVPGITVLNRQNYAQDQQVSIRGFGSRSTFGIRGVRLIVDGIPATMPDGQGQASSIDLTSVGRIEVLRGPMAQLYGNAAGGVVQVFTEDDAKLPTATETAAVGPYWQAKLGVKFSTSTPGQGLTLAASRYRTDGYREHSASERSQLNARWQGDVGSDTHVSVVLNALDQPDSQDPLGLSRKDWETQGPRYVVPAATLQDTSKTVRQQQLGTVVEHRFSEDTLLSARAYAGERSLGNALPVPVAAQLPATSSGGIVQFDRRYAGLGAQLARRVALGAGRALRITGGVEYDGMVENRRGYVNNGGVQGALKRDERNTVDNRDAYLQASIDWHPQWTLTGGLRSVDVRFRTQDHFITKGNPDDSGGVDYRGVNPVLGLTWRAAPGLSVYASAGRGLETPAFSELAYRSDGLTGLNTALRASRSKHLELGGKWKIADGQRLDASLFAIGTRDEIVVATNVGGRSTYKNADSTRRRGLELSYVGQLNEVLRGTLSLTALHARFDNGNRLSATPERSAFAELAWQPRAAWGGFNAGIEVVHIGALSVNDLNTDAAPAATTLNLRTGFEQDVAGWHLTQLVRVDNAGNRRYAGSVIVNEGSGRFFEPALPRNWLLAATARHAF